MGQRKCPATQVMCPLVTPRGDCRLRVGLVESPVPPFHHLLGARSIRKALEGPTLTQTPRCPHGFPSVGGHKDREARLKKSQLPQWPRLGPDNPNSQVTSPPSNADSDTPFSELPTPELTQGERSFSLDMSSWRIPICRMPEGWSVS